MLIIAHRGYSHIAPENTNIAISMAHNNNFAGVEIDVQMTKDKKVVVFHDENLKRLANKDVALSQSLWSEIKNLDVGIWKNPQFKGETIPTLDDVLNIYPKNKKLFIELKGVDSTLSEKVYEITKKYPQLHKNIFFISFNHTYVNQLKKLLPHIKGLYILSFSEKTAKNHTVKTTDALLSIIKTAKNNNIDGLDFEMSSFIKKSALDLVKKNNLIISIWSYKKDDTTINKNLSLKLGVDYFTSNFI